MKQHLVTNQLIRMSSITPKIMSSVSRSLGNRWCKQRNNSY